MVLVMIAMAMNNVALGFYFGHQLFIVGDHLYMAAARCQNRKSNKLEIKYNIFNFSTLKWFKLYVPHGTLFHRYQIKAVKN